MFDVDGRLRAETTDRELLTRSNSWRYTTRHIVNAQKKRAVMPERWA